MKVAIENSKLREICDYLTPLVEDVRLNISEAGWEFITTDPAHIALLHMEIDSRAFPEYEAEEEVVLLALKRLRPMLKHIPAEDIVTLETTATKMLCAGGPFRWRIRLDDSTDISDPKIPSEDFKSSCEVTSEDLKKAIKAAAVVGTDLFLRIEQGNLIVHCRGDFDEMEMAVPIKPTPDAVGLYDLEYVQGCVKALPDGMVNLRMANDRPFSLAFETWNSNLRAEYLIAPRVPGGD